MATGTIISNLGEGLYEVEVDYGADTREAWLAKAQVALADFEQALSDAEQSLLEAQIELRAATTALDAAIDAYEAASSQDRPALKTAVDKAVTERITKLDATNQAQRKKRDTLADVLSQREEVRRLEGLNLIERVSIWSADYRDDLTGEVPVIAIPGENQNLQVAAFDNAQSEIVARDVQTSEQVFVNVALLPGWQKYKPTHRVGVLTALSGDFGVVSLEGVSSAQGLDINQAPVIADVPIEYLSCNGDAFEVGDRVVVAFEGQSWSSPKIVGFESNPRGCYNWWVWRTQGVAFFDLLPLVPDYWNGWFTSSLAISYRINSGAWNTLRYHEYQESLSGTNTHLYFNTPESLFTRVRVQQPLYEGLGPDLIQPYNLQIGATEDSQNGTYSYGDIMEWHIANSGRVLRFAHQGGGVKGVAVDEEGGAPGGPLVDYEWGDPP